jgi:uncharacterized membrane protein YhaH (DUF805 family)
MHPLHLLFSPSGRLGPRAFLLGVLGVYAAGAASQWLTVPDIIGRLGLWPFAAVQGALTWIWYALHARRLHDAGRRSAVAAGAAVLYGLAVVLLLIIGASFFTTSADLRTGASASATGALELMLFIYIVSHLLGAPSFDLGSAVVAILVALAVVPVIMALGVTMWAATRPGAPAAKA